MGKKEKKTQMDEIKGVHDIYKNTFFISTSIAALFVTIILIFINNNVSLDFSAIPSPAVRIGLEIALEVGLFFGLDAGLYYAVMKYQERTWAAQNPRLIIKGDWLHIHDKKKVRIGKLTIRQSFYDIEVRDAINISPNAPELVEKSEKTKWYYTNARLFDQTELAGIDLLGCYVSTTHEKKTNRGIHQFDEMIFNEDTKRTIQLCGTFSDTFSIAGNLTEKATDKRGELLFYEMTPALKNHLVVNGVFSEERLADLHTTEDPALLNEPFVIKLKEVIKKHSKTAAK